MELERSPLAFPFPEELPEIAGVELRVARARYKNWDRADLTFITLGEGTAVAGVFTQSACASSEVELGREQVNRARHAPWLSMPAIPTHLPAIAGAKRSSRSWSK
jgi:glutamate N-acetyltransferase/amino-acid N-acetyltransferase